jgi:hypothetical protein
MQTNAPPSDDASVPCRCELLQGALDAGCSCDISGEALLDRIAVPERERAAFRAVVCEPDEFHRRSDWSRL